MGAGGGVGGGGEEQVEAVSAPRTCQVGVTALGEEAAEGGHVEGAARLQQGRGHLLHLLLRVLLSVPAQAVLQQAGHRLVHKLRGAQAGRGLGVDQRLLVQRGGAPPSAQGAALATHAVRLLRRRETSGLEADQAQRGDGRHDEQAQLDPGLHSSAKRGSASQI